MPIAIPQAGFARHFGPQQRSDRNRRFETIRVKLDDVEYIMFFNIGHSLPQLVNGWKGAIWR